MIIEFKPSPLELVLLGAVLTPNGRRWMFLNPGETWEGLPPTHRFTIVFRVGQN